MLVKGSSSLPEPTGNILLIQLGDIGDVVLTLPVVKALHDLSPKNRIVLCVREKARELIEDCPWIVDVLPIVKATGGIWKKILLQKDFLARIWKHDFDVAIDFREGDRGAILTFLSRAAVRIGRYAEGGTLWRNRLFTHLVLPEDEYGVHVTEHHLGILDQFHWPVWDRSPRLIVSEKRKERAREILHRESALGDRPIVALQPFSPRRYKEWGSEACAQMIDYIWARYGMVSIIMGSQQQREQAEKLAGQCRGRVFNLAGRSTIGELVGILDLCALYIGVDTADLHIAAIVGTPTIGIFGPSAPVSWAPQGDLHGVVSKQMPCLPCREKGCDHSGISRCLDELSFEDIKTDLDRHIFRLGLA